jgi:hypothetical protein
MHPAAWHPDPTGRHQFRYWDGSTWTEHVANDGVTASDPLAATTQAAGYATTDTATTYAATVDEPELSLAAEVAALKRDGGRLQQIVSGQNGPDVSQNDPLPQMFTGANGRNTVATASAVIGSIAILAAFVPVFGVLGVIAGVGAIIFGSVGRKQAKQSGVGGGAALAGIITGVTAAVIGTIITVVLVATLNSSGFLEEFREFAACVEETDDIDGCADQFENGNLFRLLG